MNEPKAKFEGPDTGIAGTIPEQFRLDFILEGEEIGRFWFDRAENRFKFEGRLNESAEIFTTAAARLLDGRIVDEVRQLKQEIDFLRSYGNKDCTAMADDALEVARQTGEKK